MIQTTKIRKPKIVSFSSSRVVVEQNPILGNLVYIHGVPDGKFDELAEMLEKGIQKEGETLFLECHKSRDRVKTFFIYDPNASKD